MAVTSRLADDGETRIIAVEGDFGPQQYKAFRDSLMADNGARRYVVDLSQTRSLDSSALALLLWLREQAVGQGAAVILRGASSEVRHTLELSQFERLFTLE
ncbi:MAG: STAS domain-containing protein [Pseudomonadota bacterium]|nr:STAS domain-containing protein [Pseudomonadota bacterium]